MNNNYDEFLEQVFQLVPTAKNDYDFSPIINSFGNASMQDIIKNENFMYSVFDVASEMLSFLNQYKYSYSSEFSFHHIQTIAEIIKTVMIKLENTSNSQNYFYELTASLVIIRQIEYGSNFYFWQQISSNLSVNKDWREGCLAIIKSFDTLLPVSENTPIYEKELLHLYEKGIKEKNFSKIYAFIEALENGGKPVCDSFMISESARFLSWFDMKELVQAINSKKDTLSIFCLLQNLTNDKKLELCLETSNHLAQFECIRQVVSIRSKSDLSPEQTQLMSNCITKLSHSDDLWQQFLVYFNTYPLRYPALQTSLGKALAQISDEKIIQYVDAINLDKSDISREFINKCADAFLRKADERKTNFFLNKIYNKWNNFIKNDEFYAFEVFETNFADVVIRYLSHIRQEKLYKEIEQIVVRLFQINTEWFYSGSQQISCFHILLSKLLIFSYAWKEAGYNLKEKDKLSIEIDNLSKNLYLFHICKLKDKTILAKIKNNLFGKYTQM